MAESNVKRHVRGIRCVLCDSPVVKNIKLFPFPTQPSLRKAWLQFAKQYTDEVNPKSSQICSQHFEEGSWTLVQKKIGEFGIGTSYVLNPDAVPSIMLLPSVQSTKSILESKNSLLSMIMAPKLEPPKYSPTKDISKKALHASIESVEKIFEECTVCGASKRGRVVLHKLPDTILLKMKWLDFIEQTTKKRLQIPMCRVRICSQHFDDLCYNEEQSVMINTGYGVKIKKVMKKSAVPSIFWVVKNGVQEIMIVKDEESQNNEDQSISSGSVKVKTEPEAGEVEIQSVESNSGLVQSTRSNLENLLNKSVQKYIRPKSEKEMYNLLSKCEKEEIQKIKSIRGGGDEKPNLFACHCGEGFLSQALLSEHRKVHITPLDCIFKCSICQAKFHTHRTYDQHLITHFGLNRRLCAFCGQSLSSKVDFNKHIQTVHGGKGAIESTEKLSALLKQYGKSSYEPENEFEIEIDFDNPEPEDTLLPLQTESSISQSSGQSKDDCLGIIDKIAKRLKNFKPSDCETRNHFSSGNDAHDDESVEKISKSSPQTKSIGQSKTRSRASVSFDSTKRNESNQFLTPQYPAKRIKCSLDPFTDIRCSFSKTEISRNCLVIQIPKIDYVFTHLKEAPTITMNSETLQSIHNTPKSTEQPSACTFQGPLNTLPETSTVNTTLNKKKKKQVCRYGTSRRRRRKRTKTCRDVKVEVFEYKVEPILDPNNLEKSKEASLSLTEESLGEDLKTFKSENVEQDLNTDVSVTDLHNMADWSLVMNTDSVEEQPVISEGVDENQLVNGVEDYGSQKTLALVDEYIQDNANSLSSNNAPETPSRQGDSGIILNYRSITEDEFNDQNDEKTTDSRTNSPLLCHGLSITNMITNIVSASIKIEPLESSGLNHARENVCTKDINDTKINFASTEVKIKQEPCENDNDESSANASGVSEPIVFHDQEPSVFFSQSDLDHQDRAPTMKSDSSFQFQNVNLYDGEIDPKVVDDQTKSIVDDLLQKLNIKKEKEAKITMEYFPTKLSGPTEYSCIDCNEGFHHEAMLEEHQKFHNKEKPFLCRICSSQFQEYTTYTGHLTQHVGKNTKICFMCGFRTSTCRTLTNHFNAHHKKEDLESSGNHTSTTKTNNTVAKVPDSKKNAATCSSDSIKTFQFKCELCHLICIDSEHLKRHLVSDCNVVKGALRRTVRT